MSDCDDIYNVCMCTDILSMSDHDDHLQSMHVYRHTVMSERGDNLKYRSMQAHRYTPNTIHVHSTISRVFGVRAQQICVISEYLPSPSVCLVFFYVQQLISYQDVYWLVITRTRGDFIVLLHWEGRPPVQTLWSYRILGLNGISSNWANQSLHYRNNAYRIGTLSDSGVHGIPSP